jgi:basic amino acid/polyamine antiporter, APA family
MQDSTTSHNPAPPSQPQLERRLGLLNATSINMSNMVGTGPFITFPLIIGAMGGPQALLGWLLGAVIAIADGMVWSELAAALPGSGGSYVYLRDSFGRASWGRFWAFLFIFQMICSGPLEIASGNIAIAQYVDYLWPGLTPLQDKLVAAAAGLLATILLYRKITSIAKLMMALWVGMLITVGWVIISGLLNFNPSLAFSFPPNAFSFSTGFFMGLGSATLYVMYCYLGYYGVCYLGDEVIDPPRTIPRALIISVLAVLAINFLLSLGIIGVIPWREAVRSQFIASLFMEKIYGNWAGIAISIMIIWTAFASIYALILTYSRIPYAAALDGNFFRVFGKLHVKKDFPHISLLLIGGLSIIASIFDLADVINALMTARILVQFVGQIFAVIFLRRFHPEVQRPFKMFLYPLPCLIALLGWIYIFGNAGAKYIAYGLLTLFAGCVAFLIMSRRSHAWPFAAANIRFTTE